MPNTDDMRDAPSRVKAAERLRCERPCAPTTRWPAAKRNQPSACNPACKLLKVQPLRGWAAMRCSS